METLPSSYRQNRTVSKHVVCSLISFFLLVCQKVLIDSLKLCDFASCFLLIPLLTCLSAPIKTSCGSMKGPVARELDGSLEENPTKKLNWIHQNKTFYQPLKKGEAPGLKVPGFELESKYPHQLCTKRTILNSHTVRHLARNRLLRHNREAWGETLPRRITILEPQRNEKTAKYNNKPYFFIFSNLYVHRSVYLYESQNRIDPDKDEALRNTQIFIEWFNLIKSFTFYYLIPLYKVRLPFKCI